MTNPDFRALCAELADELYFQTNNHISNKLIARARAALAEPESIQARIAKSDAAIEASMERIRSLAAPARAALAKREHIFPTPSQAAECGGPCYEGNYCPEACDCGLYRPPALAEPEAEGPSEKELYDLFCEYERDPVESMRAALARWGRPAAAPVPVSERLPEANTKVLAHYFNCLGKGRTICAIWVPAKSRSDDYGGDDYGGDYFTEYDEEDDKFYWPEGWYEVIENWDELGWVKVDEGEIAYWQPLPKWPANALPLPAPEAEGPTDEEVEVWADQQGFIRGHGDHPCGFWIDDGDAGAFARAVLARWGRPFPTPSVEK